MLVEDHQIFISKKIAISYPYFVKKIQGMRDGERYKECREWFH